MSLLKLPGLIDVHVHLRTPGQEEKEDFYTGSKAALAGGFTTILDMPNNKIPITSLEVLNRKIEIAKKETVCDIGFYFGSLGDNLEEFEKIKDLVFGIKLYLNNTTGNFLISEEKLTKIYNMWNNPQPIFLHCENETLEMALRVIKKTRKKTHIGHISSKEELKKIIAAKNEGLPVTCGATPHHLFLTSNDAKKIGSFALMKPFLKTANDIKFLWENLNYIDVIESDHAPHTKAEKESSNPPFGIPGLETTLPLLLTAVSEKKLSIEDIKLLLFENPKKIFNIPTNNSTYIEVDENEEYEIKNENLKTKAGWSPFAGRRVKGKVKNVFLNGKKIFEDGAILTEKGSGEIIYPTVF